jgi:hypothetical protein
MDARIPKIDRCVESPTDIEQFVHIVGGECINHDSRSVYDYLRTWKLRPRGADPKTIVDLTRRDEDDPYTLAIRNDGVGGLSVSGPLSEWRISQRVDDHQLYTELSLSLSGGDSPACEGSIGFWGPPARYCGGPIRLQDIPADEADCYTIQLNR